MDEQWKVGDWCFCEFELSIIETMDGARVQEVSTGWISHSGYDLTNRCMPLLKDIKRISDNFASTSQEIHKRGHAGLNYPDIHRWLVEQWIGTCLAQQRNAIDAVSAKLNTLRQFQSDMLAEQAADCGYGFPLLRRRA